MALMKGLLGVCFFPCGNTTKRLQLYVYSMYVKVEKLQGMITCDFNHLRPMSCDIFSCDYSHTNPKSGGNLKISSSDFTTLP